MNTLSQKGYRFFGGPLNGDYLELGDSSVEQFEYEQHDYRELERHPLRVKPVHCYIKRFNLRDSKFAYFYVGSQQTHH